MNSLRLVNLFTYVALFLSVVSFRAAEANSDNVYRQCLRNCSTRFPPASGTSGVSGTSTSDMNASARDFCARECEADRSASSGKESECNSLYDQVLNDMKSAESECGKAGWGNFSSCSSRAASCGNSMALEQPGDDNLVTGINNLMGAWMMTQGAGQGAASNPCTIVDQKATAEKRERIEEQIARLQEQNQDSVTKQAELDDEYSKRQEETEEKIREAEEDVEKKKIERQTRIQEEDARIQKSILEAQKKQFANLQEINKKNIDIANLQFAQQQINIQFSDLRMSKTCREKVIALQKAMTTEPVPGAAANNPANVRTKKLTIKEAQKIKQDLKLEETTCLQMEALKRTGELKALQDKRTLLQAEVDTLNRATEDESKAIEIEKKAFEDLKANMTKEEQVDADNKFKKLNTLSASLARFKETIEKKKKSQQDRIALREQQIQRLILSKNEVVVKELDVNALIQDANRTRRNYSARCCPPRGSSGAYRHPSCSDSNRDAIGTGSSGTTR